MRRTITNFRRLVTGAEPNENGDFEPLSDLDYKWSVGLFSAIAIIILLIVISENVLVFKIISDQGGEDSPRRLEIERRKISLHILLSSNSISPITLSSTFKHAFVVQNKFSTCAFP